MPRRHINLRTKLAAALLQIRGRDGEPLIPWEDAKAMSDDQIISLFEFDHYPYRAEGGGPDEPWNLEPRLIRAHRIKTAKKDAPEIAKIKRVLAAEDDFRRRLLAKAKGEPRPPSRWPKRKLGQKGRPKICSNSR
jgi:hypothetical protein